jgi:hypothetical protein
MDTYTSKTAGEGRSRLGHRTHSVPPSDEIRPLSGEQWLPEGLLRVKLFPGGDVQASICERTIRTARVVKSKKRQTGKLTEQDANRAARRARRGVWDACQAKEVNALVTIAKRGGFDTLDDAWVAAEAVMELLEERGWAAGRVTVPELHTGERAQRIGRGAGFATVNLGKWHVHLATRVLTYFQFRDLHELMRSVEARLLGHFPETPAERQINVDVQLRRGHGSRKRHTPASIARYLAPYVLKDIGVDDSRELNRKRYDVSRDGKKPRILEVRFNPGEVVHPQEAITRVLLHLAPQRKFSSPWKTEIAGQCVLIQSALDWGESETPLPMPPEVLDVTATDLFALISTPSAAARPPGRRLLSRDAPELTPPLSRELSFLGRTPHAKLSGPLVAAVGGPARPPTHIDEPPW